MTLVEFLQARIAEEYAEWPTVELEVQRRIVEHCAATIWHAGEPPGIDPDDVPAVEHVLRLLALPYASHEDYDPGWKP